MGTVDSPTFRSGLYQDSSSGEVSYLDLQRNVLVDFKSPKRSSVQVVEFKDPTNFIRNKISQTLRMADRPPIPMPRRTYDSERRASEKSAVSNIGNSSVMSTRSPDVAMLRSHINVGGMPVKLRNPHRRSKSSPRSGKTMSWMERRSPALSVTSKEQRPHSHIVNDENFLGTLRKMEERKTMIEMNRRKNFDRRDYIEKEKRLKEELWSNELFSLQQELDAAFPQNIDSENCPAFMASLTQTSQKPTPMSENNNNNKREHTRHINDPYIAKSNSSSLALSRDSATPLEAHNSTIMVTSGHLKSKPAAHTLQSSDSNLFHVNKSLIANTSPAVVLDGSGDPSSHPRVTCAYEPSRSCRHNKATPNQRDTKNEAQWMVQHGYQSTSVKSEQPTFTKSLDFSKSTVSNQEVQSMQSQSVVLPHQPTSTVLVNSHHTRLTTFEKSHHRADDAQKISPLKTDSDMNIAQSYDGVVVVDSNKLKRSETLNLLDLNDKQSEQENVDPNLATKGKTFLASYDSFVHIIADNGSVQSTPQKIQSPRLEDVDSSPEKAENIDDSASSLLKTADRNRKGGEGFELIVDTTPNTLLAKKKEQFLLKQLKKEEELKRKRAEREQEEERRKEEARIRQEEINAKREEDRLKRQHILEEYKKRKMEQEETQRLRETGDIISTAKKQQKSPINKSVHKTGQPYAQSLAGSVSNVSEAGTYVHSEIDRNDLNLRNMKAKRLSASGRLDWETESASSSAVSADYHGPKLYKEPSFKSNKHIIHNAICHCCLPGKVNEPTRLHNLHILEMSEARHFMILFRDTKCQFRALYTYNPESEKLTKLYGSGPSTILPSMIDRLYKYNSGRKSFAPLPSKTLSVSIDAVTIKNSLWQSSKRGNTHKRQ